MPLPKNWIVTFSGKDTFGDEVIDLEPEQFLVFAVFSRKPLLTLVGAYYDLRINGFGERADALLAIVRTRFPEYDWASLITYVDCAVANGRTTRHRREIERSCGV